MDLEELWEKAQNVGGIAGASLVVLFFIWMVIWMVSEAREAEQYAPPPSSRSSASRYSGEVNWGSKEKGWYACQVEARKRLKSPSSAKFPPYNSSVKDLVVHYPPSGYTVTAWVDAKNAFGV